MNAARKLSPSSIFPPQWDVCHAPLCKSPHVIKTRFYSPRHPPPEGMQVAVNAGRKYAFPRMRSITAVISVELKPSYDVFSSSSFVLTVPHLRSRHVGFKRSTVLKCATTAVALTVRQQPDLAIIYSSTVKYSKLAITVERRWVARNAGIRR